MWNWKEKFDRFLKKEHLMQFLLQFNYIFIYLEQLQATFNNPKISQFIGIPAKENKKAVIER